MACRRWSMYLILQVTAVCLVSVAMALSLAHALELPGKMRLDKQVYLTVQPIYYSGFFIGGGIGAGGGIAVTLILVLVTSSRSPAFLWTVFAFVALVAMHAAYWILTNPLNKFWMRQ